MALPKDPDVTTFEADEEQEEAERRLVFGMKLLFLTAITLTSSLVGDALVREGWSEVFRLLPLVLGARFSWLTWRALNRRLRFWFTLDSYGLETDPEGSEWRASYEEVTLIQAFSGEGSGPYVEVTAGASSATIRLSPEAVRGCVEALLVRCPWAVLVDAKGYAYPPDVRGFDPESSTRRRALENMAFLRRRYLRTTLVYGGLFVPCVAVLVLAMTWGLQRFVLFENWLLGICPISFIFAFMLQDGAFSTYRKLRDWDRLCALGGDRELHDWDRLCALESEWNAKATPKPVEALDVDAIVLPQAASVAGSEVTEPRTAWAWTGAERIFRAVRVYLFWTAVAFSLGFMVSRFRLFPEEPSRRRYDLILVLASAVGTFRAAWSYARTYHAVSVDPDALRLRRGDDCEGIPYPAVVGLIGGGGFGFDGDSLIDWRRLLIVTEDRRRLLAFSPGDCAALYRALRSRCPRAWGVPFRGRLERPKTVGWREPDRHTEDDLGRLAQVYSQQIAKRVGLRLAVLVGTPVLFAVLRVDGNTEDGRIVWTAWLGACVVLWVTLAAGLFRDVRHMKEMRCASAGSTFE